MNGQYATGQGKKAIELFRRRDSHIEKLTNFYRQQCLEKYFHLQTLESSNASKLADRILAKKKKGAIVTEDNRHSGKGTIIRNSKGEADNSKRSSNERRRLEEEISSLKRLLQGGEASDIVNDVCRSIKDSFQGILTRICLQKVEENVFKHRNKRLASLS